jgi:glycosyltransferase involved in cell wall biosynthesis
VVVLDGREIILTKKLNLEQKKYILILIDVYLNKNHGQHDILIKNGYFPIWLQAVITQVKWNDEYRYALPSNLLNRLYFLVKLVYSKRKQIHHVEIYPGGRFAFIFLLLCKLLRVKAICVERGDLIYVHEKKYSWLTRLSAMCVYKYAQLIWTRELYAERLFKELNITTPLRFIHNAIQEKNVAAVNQAKSVDFLWVNTLKGFRKVEWFINALKHPELQHVKAVLLGVTLKENENEIYKNQLALIKSAPPNLDVKEYIDPLEYYLNATFFVLPTNLVFLNNALLEAMSYGVVPIITEAEGASLIIENNVDGFISHFDEEHFIEKMIAATKLKEETKNKMSLAAISKTKKDFSTAYYEKKLMALYTEI